MEIVRVVIQILLVVVIVGIVLSRPEQNSMLLALCTWYLASVIREGRN